MMLYKVNRAMRRGAIAPYQTCAAQRKGRDMCRKAKVWIADRARDPTDDDRWRPQRIGDVNRIKEDEERPDLDDFEGLEEQESDHGT